MVDMTNLTNITSLQGIATYTNSMTDNILFNGGILVLFIIMLMVLSRNDEPFINTLAISSWSCFILSAFLWLSHLINTLFVLGFLFIAGFSVFYLYSSNKY